MSAWTLTTFTTRHGHVRSPFAAEDAARRALAELLADADAQPLDEAATLTHHDGTLYALAPRELAEGPSFGRPTHAEQRAQTIASGLRTNGWNVTTTSDDADGTRTVRLYAYRGRHENGAALTFTSELAKPSRSKIGRCYQSTHSGTIAMRTVAAVLGWCAKAAAYYRPASRVVAAEPVAAPAVIAEPVATEPTPAADAPVVIVACGAAKLDRTAPAGEMYTGSYHRATRRAAAVLAGTTGRVLILSAKYGLLELGDVIDPYEQRLPARTAPARWVALVAAQAAALGIDAAAVVVLAGRVYVDAARQIWADAAAPLAGTAGIGEQLARLAEIYRRPTTGVATPVVRCGHTHTRTPHRDGTDPTDRNTACASNASTSTPTPSPSARRRSSNGSSSPTVCGSTTPKAVGRSTPRATTTTVGGTSGGRWASRTCGCTRPRVSTPNARWTNPRSPRAPPDRSALTPSCSPSGTGCATRATTTSRTTGPPPPQRRPPHTRPDHLRGTAMTTTFPEFGEIRSLPMLGICAALILPAAVADHTWHGLHVRHETARLTAADEGTRAVAAEPLVAALGKLYAAVISRNGPNTVAWVTLPEAETLRTELTALLDEHDRSGGVSSSAPFQRAALTDIERLISK